MSVLINMEMPSSCRKCKLMMDCDNCEGWECYCLPLGKNIGFVDDEPEIPSEKRRDDCPLVPVPPHGALIDRDDFFATCPELVDGYKRITDDLVVIPASEEGE